MSGQYSLAMRPHLVVKNSRRRRLRSRLVYRMLLLNIAVFETDTGRISVLHDSFLRSTCKAGLTFTPVALLTRIVPEGLL